MFLEENSSVKAYLGIQLGVLMAFLFLQGWCDWWGWSCSSFASLFHRIVGLRPRDGQKLSRLPVLAWLVMVVLDWWFHYHLRRWDGLCRFKVLEVSQKVPVALDHVVFPRFGVCCCRWLEGDDPTVVIDIVEFQHSITWQLPKTCIGGEERH
jgi:hypothetical protein